MIFESKNKVGDKPEWSINTDTQTVTHIHPRTGVAEEHRFTADYMRYHLHFCEEYHPERLQRLLDNGEIFQYLSDLDNNVFDALDRQETLLQENSDEYKITVEKGDLVAVGAIGNAITQQARESVFEAMIYV